MVRFNVRQCALFRYEGEGAVEPALEDFTQAIALDPAYDKAYLHRAHAYALGGDTVPALADYEQVLALVPNHREARERLDAMRDARSQ
jgi:Tfp pilus assembly protein PilF